MINDHDIRDIKDENPRSLDAAYERQAMAQGLVTQPTFEENKGWKPQPKPKANNFPAVWNLVMQDMQNRDEFGFSKYAVHLQPFNGRDSLQDAYEEALDLCVYLRQSIFERDEFLKDRK